MEPSLITFWQWPWIYKPILKFPPFPHPYRPRPLRVLKDPDETQGLMSCLVLLESGTTTPTFRLDLVSQPVSSFSLSNLVTVYNSLLRSHPSIFFLLSPRTSSPLTSSMRLNEKHVLQFRTTSKNRRRNFIKLTKEVTQLTWLVNKIMSLLLCQWQS